MKIRRPACPSPEAIGPKRRILLALVTVGALAACRSEPTPVPTAALPSWNDGMSKTAILDFVGRVTTPGTPDFVPETERIAVFDNDGTLWAEQPMYVQLAFALDRVRALAPGHPEWRDREPFASILRGDITGALEGGPHAVAAIVTATHAGMTPAQFDDIVRGWIATARNPETGRLYTSMVYQPMLELLGYLRTRGFRTFIVSGGGVEFIRAWSDSTYGIPPEQVVGSTIRLRFEESDDQLIRLPEIAFVDDGPGKPVGIEEFIGRRPILAFGNSDGDREMLLWTSAGTGARLAGLVHHTDAEREWAYDRDSTVGRLDKALDDARMRGWVVVDMARDWNVVFKEN